MTKVEKIKYLVCEYAKSFGIKSKGWEYVYIHQDSIVNRINRNWGKEIINREYDKFINENKKIGAIMDLLNREMSELY